MTNNSMAPIEEFDKARGAGNSNCWVLSIHQNGMNLLLAKGVLEVLLIFSVAGLCKKQNLTHVGKSG